MIICFGTVVHILFHMYMFSGCDAQANTRGAAGTQSFVISDTVDGEYRNELARFRQYARLTVVLGDVQQAQALVCAFVHYRIHWYFIGRWPDF